MFVPDAGCTEIVVCGRLSFGQKSNHKYQGHEVADESLTLGETKGYCMNNHRLTRPCCFSRSALYRLVADSTTATSDFTQLKTVAEMQFLGGLNKFLLNPRKISDKIKRYPMIGIPTAAVISKTRSTPGHRTLQARATSGEPVLSKNIFPGVVYLMAAMHSPTRTTSTSRGLLGVAGAASVLRGRLLLRLSFLALHSFHR